MTYSEATKEYQLNQLMIDYYQKKKNRLLVSYDRDRIAAIDRELEALYRENYHLEQLYFITNKKQVL